MNLGWRKIVVNEKTYKYRIGRQNVVIVDTDSKGEKGKIVVDFSKLTGWSWDTIERGMNKGYFSITPKQIADYIEELKCLI